MRERLVDTAVRELLARERRLLVELLPEVASHDDSDALRESLAQLDELFLLVVVGEFNAGKSAFVNALLGAEVLEQGVTPTTSRIQMVRFGEAEHRETDPEGFQVLSYPLELLRDLVLVDTPGTNAITREHEALTRRFLPRADLVLFVTSSDRPFTESERSFLEGVRQWGKKVVVVINKADLLAPGEVGEVEEFVRRGVERLLGFEPRVFSVSARRALEGRTGQGEGDEGFRALEAWIVDELDRAERIRLKLQNPLGVGARLLGETREAADERLTLLEDDFRTLDDLERQLGVYREDLEREFGFRLADVEKIVGQMENRGLGFFDEHLRLVRMPELLNRERVRRRFEEEVVGEAPQEIERRVSELIDWLVDAEHRQWQAVSELVQRRREAHGERVLGEVNASFEARRAALLDSLGREATRAVEGYDRSAEARQLSESVQQAIAGTAILEVGAVGIGGLVAALASTTAADVTGILAAGVMATMGLLVLPARKRSAKKQLRERLGRLRERLVAGLSGRFEEEVSLSIRRLEEAVAPYTRFVRAEREALEERRRHLGELEGRLRGLEIEVSQLSEKN